MATSKQTIRAQMRRLRDAVAPSDAVAAGEAVARHIGALDAFRGADALVAYVAADNEVPTATLIAGAHAGGLPVFLPRMVERRLVFAAHHPGDALGTGSFGIPEPRRPVVAEIGVRPLIVLPLLAFDRRGTRLGRGGGHYDRASRTWPAAATRLGLAYSFQEWPELPRDAWDAPLDLVVTEAGELRCAAAAPPADCRPVLRSAAGSAATEAGR